MGGPSSDLSYFNCNHLLSERSLRLVVVCFSAQIGHHGDLILELLRDFASADADARHTNGRRSVKPGGCPAGGVNGRMPQKNHKQSTMRRILTCFNMKVCLGCQEPTGKFGQFGRLSSATRWLLCQFGEVYLVSIQ